jgi:hypothetical protein
MSERACFHIVYRVDGRKTPTRLTLVVKVRAFINVDTVCLTSNGLQKGGTTRARGSENDEHLPLANETVKVAQNVNLARLAETKGLAHQAGRVQPDIADILLVIRGLTETVYIDVLEANAS